MLFPLYVRSATMNFVKGRKITSQRLLKELSEPIFLPVLEIMVTIVLRVL